MNGIDSGVTDDVKAFQLLSEVTDEQPISQRELARRLGIALGLVNSYIRNFVAKGFIRVKNYPRNRYAYLLTPQGVAEKARLACRHVHYFTNLYTVTRQAYLQLFRELAERGIARVAFCGVDEVAEIAWLSLREVGLDLAEVMDDDRAGSAFMGREVVTLARGLLTGNHLVVITSLKRTEQLSERLRELGIVAEVIHHPALSGTVENGHDN
ncbi:MAG: winged helix-turn-helix transcriptional regulator [Deltaproteobacteria bacterium]|nr:winged helix-turn-helix transcriptional regulator [Deltaproteobacteria bacterium]